MKATEDLTIREIRASAVRIPLAQVTSFSTRNVAHRDYVLVWIDTESGVSGVGYTYAGNSGGQWLAEAINELIAPLLLGRNAGAIEDNWDLVYRDLLLIGRRGGILRALSAVDIAAWDAVGQATGLPLRHLLGGHRDRVPAYASGGYYRDGDPIEAVAGEMQRYRDLGFTRFKIKIGGLPLAKDVERVAKAREVIGPDAELALDANNAWDSADEALRAINQFEPHRIWWIEEPLSPDDLAGHAALVKKSPVTVATGEIEATRWGFGELLRRDSAEILQPDACVAGGVSEWMKIAHMADGFGKSVAPHWHANLHAQLSAAVTNCMAVEYFALREDIYNFETLVTEQLEIDDGQIVLNQKPGIGIELNEEALSRYVVDPGVLAGAASESN
jgi:L-alanine-DL-glutamate epimerase-like enolase superfamily enzyme